MLACNQKYQSGQPALRVLWLLYPRCYNLPEQLPSIALPEERRLKICQLEL